MSASTQLPPYHPDQPEVPLPSLPHSIPDPPDETPLEDQIIPVIPPDGQGVPGLPPVVLGCATFGYGIYAETDDLLSDLSLRTVRYALRAGINAFDTAPWYHPSEQVLGEALARLAPEYPRSSYKLITKVGKYGPTPEGHIYDAKSTRASVERSLKRLHTDYLDVVYLHDVEFVVKSDVNVSAGHHLDLLSDLQGPTEPLGPGEENILEGLATLRALQKEGKIRAIGIAGYPLPVLVRVCLMAASRPDIGAPNIVQTYAHQTLQCSTLAQGYLAKFEEIGVAQVTNAAPLAMGILTTTGPPEWHPMRNSNGGKAYDASREASEWCESNGIPLEDVAAQYGMKELRSPKGRRVPTVIGCKNVDEVKRTVKAWRKANMEPEEEKMAESIAAVRGIFEKAGVQGYSYACPF